MRKIASESRRIIHSGGADGADMCFQRLGILHRWQVMAHSFHGHARGNPCRVEHSPAELAVADPHLVRANKTLGRRFPTSNGFVNNLLRRNYYQVIDSNIVVAISRLVNGQVAGGTAWATQMGVDMNKPVYVFDMVSGVWHFWTGSRYKPNEPPVLTLPRALAGVGSRDLTSAGVAAIKSLF